jgi:hypothetical protein
MISSQDLRIRILCQVVEKKITKLSESLDQRLESGENLLRHFSHTPLFPYVI